MRNFLVVICFLVGASSAMAQQTNSDTMKFTIVGTVVKGDTLISLATVRRDIQQMGREVDALFEKMKMQRDEERKQVIIFINGLKKELDDVKKQKVCRVADSTENLWRK